tara:strand:+ start:806 stop:1321 length:516 start_codon:yes stop_codon:yes gene_type:complete
MKNEKPTIEGYQETIQQFIQGLKNELTEPANGWSIAETTYICFYWCFVHNAWRDNVKINKAQNLRILGEWLPNRTKGSIEAKTMNVSSYAFKLAKDPNYTIHHEKEIICKGYKSLSNGAKLIGDILPVVIDFMGVNKQMQYNAKLWESIPCRAVPNWRIEELIQEHATNEK